MSGWGSANNANSAPSYKILPNNPARGNTMFANTFLDAFQKNQINGVFALNANDVTATSGKVACQGWNLVRTGTGPLASIAINAAGTGYANTDYVVVASYDANNASANATITTNGSGVIQTVTLTSAGAGFVGTEVASVKAANGAASNGSSATFTLKFGGRASRKTYEVLVATSNIA